MREDWVECSFEDLLDYEQPTKYIVENTKYSDSYKTPVLTAGKSFLKGYTNETTGVFDNLPTIIFDDFTTASKYVDFEFKVKSSAMKILIPTSKLVNMKFAYYAMQVNKVRNDTHKRYWISTYSKKKFLLPPLPIQRTIVHKIENLFASLDKGITDLKKAQEQLKVYRQAVLKKAFEGELTKEWREKHVKTDGRPSHVPMAAEPRINYNKQEADILSDGWKWIQISEVGDIVTGNTPSKKNLSYYSSKDYNFYKPTDLEAGDIVSKSIDGLSLEGFKAGRQIPQNSILVTCIGATIGKTGLVIKEGCFNQQINAIIPFKRFNPKFIYYQAIADDFQTQIKTKASSTTLPILNKGKFSKLKMHVCSKNEQRQIVREIESRLSVCDKVEQNINEGLEKSEALRQSILKKAFEGKLLSEAEIEKCKQEADYEPACVLLEKIKKEKDEK